MIVRSLDADHDWNFGKGKNDYLVNNAAVIQDIETRLLSFVSDCFFAADAGVDWWNLMGGKSKVAVELAVSSIILNTDGVSALLELFVDLSDNRRITIDYQVVTIYSVNQTFNGSVIVGGSSA